MDKLKKRATNSSNTQSVASQALSEQQSQEEYLNALKGIKSEIYNTKTEPSEETQEETQVTTGKLQDMIENTKLRKGGDLKRIQIDSDLAEVYKLIAIREGVTLSGFVSNILESYLKDHMKEVKSLLKSGNKFLV